MQARIKKAEIEAFKSQASFIKPNTILPILSFLKIDVAGDYCHITKSNNESFLVRTISNDSEDCSFLIDERVLYSFVEFSSSEYINFTDDGNRIRIYDDRTDTKSPTDRPELFPPIEKNIDNWIAIPKLALVSVGIVGQLIFDGEIMNAKSFVFVGAGKVAGTDGNIGYYQTIPDPLPEVILRKEVAACISKMTTCQYGRANNYDFFKEDGSVYGFAKSEYQFIDLKVIFIDVAEQLSFCVNKASILKFNTLCITSISTKSLGVTFEGESGSLFFQMNEEKWGVDIKSNIPVKGRSDYFKYDPGFMNTLLKLLPCDEVFFYPGPKRYYITDADKSFLSAIMLII